MNLVPSLLCVSYQALAGIIASIINVIAIAVTDDQKTGAVVFFSMAAGITFLVIIAFYRLCRVRFKNSSHNF